MSEPMFKFLSFKDIEWKDASRGYYLTDVKQHTLWEDKKTGATLALIKFPKGVAALLQSVTYIAGTACASIKLLQTLKHASAEIMNCERR